VLVGRLDLERYKATIRGLAAFGDRRQGTDRNRAAIDWIEGRLKSFGCETERLKYVYEPPPPRSRPQQAAPSPVIASGEIRPGAGGARLRGVTAPTSVNDNPEAQPDAKLRELNSQPSAPGPRDSARYPEPRWLGMIQHDMVLFDHGMPRADGTLSPEQRPEADVNIEFQSASKFAEQALKLAFFFRDANEKYATDYPAAVGHH